MRRLRTTSPERLVAVVAALIALALSGAFAQAAISGSDDKPDPKPLDRAIHEAVTAPPVDGVTARVTFTNGLLPSGSLPQGAASPLAAGAEGRLWLAGDGRARLELLSGARPTSTGGRPTYTVRIAAKDDGGLLGAAELAWDAFRGVPLRAAVYAQGQDAPVLELEADDVSYGPIAGSTFEADPPAGTRVVEVDPVVEEHGKPTRVRGVEAVQKRLGFELSAPLDLAGLPRTSVRLVDAGGEPAA